MITKLLQFQTRSQATKIARLLSKNGTYIINATSSGNLSRGFFGIKVMHCPHVRMIIGMLGRIEGSTLAHYKNICNLHYN